MKRIDITIGLILCGMVAYAQDDTLSYEKPHYVLDEVVVTATRVHDKIKDVPLGTVVITQEEIERRGLWGIGEVLRGETGIDIKNYGSVGSVSTNSIRGSSSSQVLVLLDGRPLNSVSLGMADLSLISQNNIRRVEIVKGPISSLYGANALGGVVNFITNKPPKELNLVGGISFGTYQTLTSNFRFGYNLNRLGMLISVHHNKSDGVRTNSDYLSNGALAKFSYSFNEDARVKLTLGYDDRDMGLPGPKPGNDIPKYGDNTSTSCFDREADTTFSFQIESEYKLNERVSLEARGYIDNQIQRFFMVYDGYNPDWTTYKAEMDDRYLTTTIGGSAQINFNPSEKHKIILGLDSRKDNFDARSEVKNTDTDEIDVTKWQPTRNTTGFWVEDKWKILEFFETVGSLRYDKNSDYGNFVSPSIGAIFGPNELTRLKIFYGKAFRAPTFNDLYWPNAGNENLEVEVGTALEGRTEIQALPSLFLAASLFSRTTKDLIAWTPDTAGLWHPSNVDRSSIIGSETELKITSANAFDFSLKGTYLWAEQTKKEVVYSEYDWLTGETEIRLEEKTRKSAFVPKVSLAGNFTFKTEFGSVFEIEGKYLSKRINYYPDYSQLPEVSMKVKELPEYFIVGVRMNQKVLPWVEIFLNVENLLDKSYADQFGNSIDDQDYPRPGRTFAGGLKTSF